MRRWLLALAFALPTQIPILTHVVGLSRLGLRPTGFIQVDMPYYMANARAIFDTPPVTGLYPNPNIWRAGAPKIYFQPLILILGLLERLTGLDPGLLFALVGAIGAVVAMRVALALYDQTVGPPHDPAGQLTRIGFLWGGGLLVVTAVLLGRHPLALDPFGGWWMLNFGRVLIYPTEAWYHAVFFGCIVAILLARYRLAIGLAAVMSISHPFTGIQLLLILTAWSALERWCRPAEPTLPRWFLPACVGLMVLHLAYYVGFLGRFPEHRAVVAQWRLPWVMYAINYVPAYALAGAGVLWAMRTPALARALLARPAHRLLLVWFAVTFALAVHQFAFPPVQPLHFTRGYDYTALYLLGGTSIAAAFTWVLARRSRAVAWAGAALLMALVLSDNAVWMALTARSGLRGYLGERLTHDDYHLLQWLARPENAGGVILADSASELDYLATVYTPRRAWKAHAFTTPWFAERSAELGRFYRTGAIVPTWRTLDLLILWPRRIPLKGQLRQLTGDSVPPAPAYADSTQVVYRVKPPG